MMDYDYSCSPAIATSKHKRTNKIINKKSLKTNQTKKNLKRTEKILGIDYDTCVASMEAEKKFDSNK